MDDLDRLRKRIEDIDEKMVELMIRRNDTALEIGELKRKHGIPLRNMDIERAVMERYVRMAAGSSLPKDVAESVCKILISSSVDVQSEIIGKRIGKKVAIVGGNGKMGMWMRGYLKNADAEVIVIDVSTGSMDDLKDADVVVISVPISSVGDALDHADRVCNKDTLIFDIASVKSPFLPKLREMAKNRKVCSVHPMFGPSAATIVDRNIVICDCGRMDAVSEAEGLFADGGANIVMTSVERHDELMAYVLAFAHASNIVFFTALRDSGIPFDELSSVSSTTFNNTLRASVPVSRENASFYHEIQDLNINVEEMWGIYEKAVFAVKEASLSKDPERFEKIMDNGRKYFERS
jgi:chorismate mutase/prephenate dehydrogenase